MGKFRVSAGLAALARPLFANSPFLDGRPMASSLSLADLTDNRPDRNRQLSLRFRRGLRLPSNMSDYASTCPMYFFVRRKGEYLDASGHSFRDLHGESCDSCRRKSRP